QLVAKGFDLSACGGFCREKLNYRRWVLGKPDKNVPLRRFFQPKQSENSLLMDRNTIIGLLLIFALLMAWQQYMKPKA
ncbi:MAG TPA: hypothetical protein PK198_07920, partial [Saprospiraceae bacterium]|nr:hypothetical protein [Saprospiraceae bacterium]